MINWDDTDCNYALVHKQKVLVDFLTESPELVNDTWIAKPGTSSSSGWQSPYWTIEKRPQPKPWNGEGLPPVGTECVYTLGSTEYKVQIKYCSRNHIIFDGDTGNDIYCLADDYKKFLKPLDTRTDDEKAFEQINDIPRIYINDARAFLDKIKAGKIHGIKWAK